MTVGGYFCLASEVWRKFFAGRISVDQRDKQLKALWNKIPKAEVNR